MGQGGDRALHCLRPRRARHFQIGRAGQQPPPAHDMVGKEKFLAREDSFKPDRFETGSIAADQGMQLRRTTAAIRHDARQAMAILGEGIAGQGNSAGLFILGPCHGLSRHESPPQPAEFILR